MDFSTAAKKDGKKNDWKEMWDVVCRWCRYRFRHHTLSYLPSVLLITVRYVGIQTFKENCIRLMHMSRDAYAR